LLGPTTARGTRQTPDCVNHPSAMRAVGCLPWRRPAAVRLQRGGGYSSFYVKSRGAVRSA